MINVNGLKRNAKNIVKKYSEPQIKVREATSNDPWGPSSTIMAEIADLTYNVVAFSEIMQMIWRRLNDHGKNWRHVYKALVVLEYLIKTGTEKVAQQCIENIFAIQTLKDFQYMEDNKDHGMNIREKSKKLVALLKDSEKLKAERARAIKAKSRLAESMSSVGKTSSSSAGFMMSSSSGSSGGGDTSGTTSNNNNNNNTINNNGNNYSSNFHNDSGSSSTGAHLPDLGALAILGSEIEIARPLTASEEENQLKIALALSKEEAEQQEKTRKNDELRLKLALDVSKKSASGNLLDELSTPTSSNSISQKPASIPSSSATTSKSTIDDLLGLTIPPPDEPQNDPWSVDPWSTPKQQQQQQQQSSSLSSTIKSTTTTTTSSSSIAPPLSSISTIPQMNLTTSSNSFNLLQSQLPMMTNPLANTVPEPILGSSNNNIFNKRPMSKNPFED